jgi:hypothetical protein
MAHEIHCSRVGCSGIIDTRSPGHIKRKDGTKLLYFCDSDCEERYDQKELIGNPTLNEDFFKTLFPEESGPLTTH